MNPTALTPKSRAILAQIDEYFDHEQHTVETEQNGRVLNLEIQYYDFLPKRTVQRAIEDMDECINIVSIDRQYGDSAAVQILVEYLYTTEVYADADGVLMKTRIMDLFDAAAITSKFCEGELVTKKKDPAILD